MIGAADARHQAEILNDTNPSDVLRLLELRADPATAVVDASASIAESFAAIRPAPTAPELAEPWVWVHYPWRRTLVRLPGAVAFRRLRLDRNRNKITEAEQRRLAGLRIGVVGLSVGHSVAHTLALEGLCGMLRLADFDVLELSNLNRIPATVLDLGRNKAQVVARRIAELDPYLDVQVQPDGLTEQNLDAFFDGLDVVVEECDSLDIKVLVRQAARARGIPVLMETSDRGMFDSERFDLEPDRPLFHGLLGDVDPGDLRGLSTRDKAPHIMRIIDAAAMSTRMAASMVEVDRTISTWPQLGGDVQLGAATVAAAVRRLGTGRQLPSGRIRLDLDQALEALADPPPGAADLIDDFPPAQDDLTRQPADTAIEAVIQAIRLAPSGGNVQPWSIVPRPDRIDIDLVPARSSAMDVQYRGSLVAIGAATFSARVAAAAHGRTALISRLPAGDPLRGPVVSIELRPGAEEGLAGWHRDVVQRITNRGYGAVRELDTAVLAELRAAAQAEGADLSLVTDRRTMSEVADLLAESDRIRYLTPLLHSQMMSELSWPGRDRLDLGIDVRTLGLDAADLAKLQVAGRGEVMAQLAEWQVGSALGDDTRDRLNASSALAVVTVDGEAPADYLRGGSAVCRLWVAAQRAGLGVQPTSPVFLYARTHADRLGLAEQFADQLAELDRAFAHAAGLGTRTPVLVLRMSHDVGPAVRSERLKREDVVIDAPTSTGTELRL